MNIDRNRLRPTSLRRRLLGLVSLAALVILGLATDLTYRQAQTDVQELMDGQLSKMGRLMLVQAQQGAEHLANLPAAMANLRGTRNHENDIPLEYQVGKADGTVLVRSEEAPNTPLNGPLGFSTLPHDNEPWRSLILETDDGSFRIQVAESIPKRDKEAIEIATKTVSPLLVIFPLLLAAIYFSIRRGLKPLDNLAREVLNRSPENLIPLENRATPHEVLPLVAAINRLLFRLSGSLENERRFTADAAHELRTPLAAVRIQTQVALLSENNDQRQHALSQALAGIDRATRILEQMLRLSRLDPLAQIPSPAKVNLAELLEDVIAEFRDHDRDHTPASRIESDIDESAPALNGDADLLRIALRNLIDNALRYSPPDSPIQVCLRREKTGLTISVSDRGPGVDEAELPRLIERFYRGTAVTAEGSGLGLTLVHRIAELHGARLELRNRDGGGFEARLRCGA
jgi:two-component system sensor histidine kinase QseC